MGIVKQIIEERELSFWDHLEVLRWMLFRVIIAWVVLAVGFFIIMPDFFDKIILAPCYNDFVFYDFLRYIGQTFNLHDSFFTQDDFEVHLQNINLASQFFTHITTSFLMAVVVTAPYLVYEIWRFVRPALYPNEMKGVRKAFSLGTGFFFLGVAVGYFMIFPLALRFLATYQLSAAIENEISLNSYIENFMMLVLMMGVAFELPLVTWLLSLIGLVTRSMLREYRRHAFLAIVIFAAIITPTGDPFTLSAVSLPLYLLYELSIFMVQDKKDDDDEEDEEEEKKKEEPKKEEPKPEGKENQLVGQKVGDQKALEAKGDTEETTETPTAEAPSDTEKAPESTEQPTSAEETPAEAAAVPKTEIPEESEFTPENAPAPEVELEEEYYIEDDEVKVRMVPKETPAEEVTETAEAEPAAESAVAEAPKVEETHAAFEKLYKNPEDQFVDGGDGMWGSGGFTETIPLDPHAPYKEIPDQVVKPEALRMVKTGADFLEETREKARAAQRSADQAAKLAQQAATEALEAAKRAAEAANEAIRRAEEVAQELTRREAEAKAIESLKPQIDVSKIFYDVDNLPE